MFICAAGIFADSLFVRWTHEGTVPIGLIAAVISLSLPGVALLAGAWVVLRFFVEDR